MKRKFTHLLSTAVIFISLFAINSITASASENTSTVSQSTEEFCSLSLTSSTVYSGVCGHRLFGGDNLRWTLDTDTGILTIDGSGEMADFSAGDSPWNSYKTKIRHVVINKGATCIGDGAFWGFGGIESVDIPTTVKRIGRHAFSGCYGLTDIYIPDGVTRIGEYAFANCDFKDLDIPSSVNIIESGAFSGCSYLESIAVPYVGAGYNIFDDAGGHFGYIFGYSSTLSSNYHYNGARGYYYYNIPSSLKSVTIKGGYVRQYSFQNCKNITTVVLEGGLVERDAFKGCSNIERVYVPRDFHPNYDDNRELSNASWKYFCSSHTNVSWYVSKDPNCTMDGVRRGICTNCKYRVYEDTDALGHNFVDYENNDDATCTSDGTKTAQCERCSVTDTQTAENSRLGHDFRNYISDNNATCIDDGTKTAECVRCTQTDTITDVNTAYGHDLTEASCTETSKCNRTGCSYEGESPLGHSFINYIYNNDITCTSDGTKTAKCERCNETDTVTILNSRLGHSFANYVSNCDSTCISDGTKTSKCERCTATDTITDENSKLGHYWSVATCVEPSKCQRNGCNYINGTALGHDMIDATCIDSQRCRRDGCTYTVGEALGHDIGVATCGQSAECRREGCSFSVSALGHNFVNYVSNGDATCMSDGTETARCERCTATDTKTDENSKLGHDVGTATCGQSAECRREGCSFSVSALGHNFVNYVSNGDATCTSDGTETAKCERCSATDTKPDENSKLGHDMSTATCTQASKCRRAGCEYTEGAPAHKFGTVYKTDENGHWYECICGQKKDYSEHSFNSTNQCKNCGYKLIVSNVPGDNGNLGTDEGKNDTENKNTATNDTEKEEDFSVVFISGVVGTLAFFASAGAFFGTRVILRKKKVLSQRSENIENKE